MRKEEEGGKQRVEERRRNEKWVLRRWKREGKEVRWCEGCEVGKEWV